MKARAQCWSNPVNASRRPSWRSKKEESVNAGADVGLRAEYSVIGMDICIEYENNNFWVENTFETYTDKELEIGDEFFIHLD